MDNLAESEWVRLVYEGLQGKAGRFRRGEDVFTYPVFASIRNNVAKCQRGNDVAVIIELRDGAEHVTVLRKIEKRNLVFTKIQSQQRGAAIVELLDTTEGESRILDAKDQEHLTLFETLRRNKRVEAEFILYHAQEPYGQLFSCRTL